METNVENPKTSAKEKADERLTSRGLFSVQRQRQEDITERIVWKNPEKDVPDEDTTVLIQTTDGEVTGGFLTHNEADQRVWRLEYWPEPLGDKTDREVVAWAEWPGGISAWK